MKERGKPWTTDETAFLCEQYGRLTARELAERLPGRSVLAVKYRVKALGLRNEKWGKRFWTPDDVETLVSLYPDTPTVEIAERLGRDLSSCYAKAATLGLKKSQAYLDSPAACRLRCGDNVGAEFRFKKGQTPPNKGVKMPGWAPGRMAETQFKKGDRNGVARQKYQPIGTERITKDGYLQRKVNDDLPMQNRWKMVHRLIWEEVNGPIPAGHNLTFKDGDKTNCAIENLELISRAEWMRRHTFHNYPDEVQSQIRVLAGFRRRINDYAKKQDRRSAESAV